MPTTTPRGLEQLPDPVLSQIVSLLSQQSKTSLALCSYKLYQLVQPELYRNLLLTPTWTLHSKTDFRDSLATIVGSTSNSLASQKARYQIYQMRQEVLLQSLTINPQLCQHIKRLTVVPSDSQTIWFGTETEQDDIVTEQEGTPDPTPMLKLLDYIKSHCANLEAFVVLGGGLSSEEMKQLPHLKRADLDDPAVTIGPEVRKLVLNEPVSREPWAAAKQVDQLDQLMFNDDVAQGSFWKSWEKKPLKLRKLKLIVYHGFNDYNIDSRRAAFDFIDSVDAETLEGLELVMGCDHIACDCLMELVNEHLLKRRFKLSHLAIEQRSVHRDQNYSEKFDIHVCHYLGAMQYPQYLKYLSVGHCTPKDFNSGNGFEGNFIKRRRLWDETLSRLTHLQTLIFPHFLEFAACFEQVISDLLWNGCKCEHCSDYLSIFDHYIMTHQYYDGLVGYVTDLISPMLFGTAGRVLSQRLVKDCDLNLLRYPPLDRYWDLHQGSIVHFKGSKEEESCEFNQSIFAPLATCISHFLKTYVDSFAKVLPGLQLTIMSGEYFDVDHGLVHPAAYDDNAN